MKRLNWRMFINRQQKKVRASPYQRGVGPVVRKRVVKANVCTEGKIVLDAVAVILRTMAGAAALTPPPAPVAPLPPPPRLLYPLVVRHDLPPLGGKGGVAGPPHTSPTGVVVATAPIDVAVTVMTKAETGGGA